MENRKEFGSIVKDFEKTMHNHKREAGIIVNSLKSGKRRIKRMMIMIKQMNNAPCVVMDSDIIINKVGDEPSIDNTITPGNLFYKKSFDNCKNNLNLNRVMIPIGINNFKNKGDSHHSNLIIIDLTEKKAWRIEPNNKAFDDFKQILTPFFRQMGLEYSGFYHETCSIKHGGLCKYVVYAQYMYGSQISHAIIKKIILRFLKDDIIELCSL
jgi:hypothetical protein